MSIEGLLVDAPDALQRADVESVLRPAIAGAFALELAVRLLVELGLLQRGDLRLGQHQALLRALGLERLQPLLHGLQIVPQPHAAHAGRRDRVALLLQLVGDAHLAERRLLDRHLDDGLLDLRVDAVLLDRLAPRHLGQRQIAAFLVELLKAIEAVAAVAHDLAGLADVAELLGQFQQADLGLDDFLFRASLWASDFCAADCEVRSPSGSLPSQSAKTPTTSLMPVRSNPNFFNDQASSSANASRGTGPRSSSSFLKKIDRSRSETPRPASSHHGQLRTHKTAEVQAWLDKHPRFKLHFIPTSSSWLNLVERFFAEITGKRIRRGTFASVAELEAAIEDYLLRHNASAKPYVWTKSAAEILAKERRALEKLEAIKSGNQA